MGVLRPRNIRRKLSRSASSGSMPPASKPPARATLRRPKQFLIQQRALDGRLAAPKHSEEAIEIRFQRLNAARIEASGAGNAQAPEAAGIDKAQFPARLELQNRVRVLENF